MSDDFAVIVRAAGLDLDKCNVALPLEITHSRGNVENQPDAPTCTFVYLGATAPCALGDPLEVEVAGVVDGSWGDPDVQWTDIVVSWTGIRGRSLRFKGFVSSIKAVEVQNEVRAWEVQATGNQALLGRVQVDLSRPVESDVARVQAIAAAAGVVIEVVGPPGVTLRADAIFDNALDAMHEVCKSSGGILWQQRDGTLTYGTMYRADFMPSRIISCKAILDGIEWSKDASRVINHVIVKYGPNESALTQDTYRDDPSIAQWGFRSAGEVTTLCNSSADAGYLAAAILAKRKQPRWVMPGVVVLRNSATDAQWSQVATLDFGHTAFLDVEETPTPTPGQNTPWTVEGWVETWESAGRRVQFFLSEYRLGDPVTWDTARAQTWDYWRSNHSWLSAMVEV